MSLNPFMLNNFASLDLNRVSAYDFELPKHLVAQHPTSIRSHSRLLDGRGKSAVDLQFNQLPSLLNAGDLMVFNNTQVMKARLYGEKVSGGKLELLIERILALEPGKQKQQEHRVVAHMKVSKKPRPGETIKLCGVASAVIIGRWPEEDGPLYLLSLDTDPYELMQKHGHVPLPPYVEHSDDAQDELRYQSIFAKHLGAVAAPTASLHFDSELLLELSKSGIRFAQLTLHIGAGTFQPVKTDNINNHIMHSEWYCIPQETVQAIKDCQSRGSRVIAVGTTCVRTLESWASSAQLTGETQIFIRPGFEFKVVDLMITNFHLPKSTLLMLVSAFTSQPHIMHLYRHAVQAGYRFFSYGDAMLLERQKIN